MKDPTELTRRVMLATGMPRIDCLNDTGRKWTTGELVAEFEVLAFLAPFVVVRRRADGVKGSLEFMHSPRLYFNWQED